MLTLFAQTPTPSPIAPTSGDFWNPSNWAPLVQQLGIGGFFALIFFAYIAWNEWRRSRQPSNAAQVDLSNARDSRLRRVMRQMLKIHEKQSKVANVDISAESEKILDLLEIEPEAKEE